jgi:hypothetical protein
MSVRTTDIGSPAPVDREVDLAGQSPHGSVRGARRRRRAARPGRCAPPNIATAVADRDAERGGPERECPALRRAGGASLPRPWGPTAVLPNP